uniref:WAP domain-containing protein n=1 Tax=Ficedula albicollis TaxID=59894 RepID=U3JPK7_FICAL
MPPEKPGICPLAEEAPLAPCGTTCTKDWQCPGAEKCCSSSRCGYVCSAPEPDKPGECPKVRPQRTSEPCTETDSCTHDRDCSRQEKCCFSGCAMRCTRPAQEHPGECPQAEPCWDPRRRRGSQCLDDSVCRREEKCCDTGCGWECVAVPRDSGGKAGGQCVEECQADSQCPRGQRCTSIGCGHICMDIPGGRVGVCPIPREMGTCLDLCNFDEECPWGHKCCSNGCGHICTPASLQGQPLTPTQPSRDRAQASLAPTPGHPGPSSPMRTPHHDQTGTLSCQGSCTCGESHTLRRYDLPPSFFPCLPFFCVSDEHTQPQFSHQETTLPYPQSVTLWLCPSPVLSGAQRSVRLTHSVPGDRGAPAPPAAVSAWTLLEAEVEHAPGLGVGPAWTSAASMRSVPGATSAAATAVAMSARGCLVMLCNGRAAPLQQEDAFLRGHGTDMSPSWPVPSPLPPAIKRVLNCPQLPHVVLEWP